MEKNKSLKNRLLPIGHALLVNAAVAIVTFLYHGKVIGDLASLFLLIAALVILAPVFFWMKPKEVAPWVSDVTAACAHLAFSGVLWGIAVLLDLGRTNAMLYYALLFALGFYACLIGLDMIIVFFGKIKR